MVYVFLIFLHKLMVCCDWFWQLWSLQKQNWQSTFTQATSGYSIPQHRCESSHVSGRARTEKKKHYVPLGSPAHFRTQPLPVMCLIVLHMYVTFSNVLWLMPWQIPLTVVYWVCIKSRPPFENMCWVATNDQCLLSTYLWSISMLLRAPFLYTLAHTSIMVGELTLR